MLGDVAIDCPEQVGVHRYTNLGPPAADCSLRHHIHLGARQCIGHLSKHSLPCQSPIGAKVAVASEDVSVAVSAAPLRVLGAREAALLAAERSVLADLRETLAAGDADQRGLAAVRQAAADLDDLFLLVVVGEFNAGKSALLNVLLGGPYLEEGVTPTTAE